MAGSMVVANLAWPSHWILLIGSFTSTFGAALQCLCSMCFFTLLLMNFGPSEMIGCRYN